MNLIADDMVTNFTNQFDTDYDIEENVNIKKFSNGNVDSVAGCGFVFPLVSSGRPIVI